MKKLICILAIFPIFCAFGARQKTPEEQLEQAVAENDIGRIIYAISSGATNKEKVTKDYLARNNPQFITALALVDSASNLKNYSISSASMYNFCFAKKKIWKLTIADIKRDSNYREGIFVYIGIDNNGNLKTEKVWAKSELTEAEKFIWAKGVCYIDDTLKDADMINCYFDLNEKYCSIERNKEILTGILNPDSGKKDEASSWGNLSAMLKPPENQGSEQSVLKQIASERLERLNKLEESIKQKAAQ
ncbi:MAG: hypothetical protein LBK26_04040 [Rickettsiales bacterium]|jgi:hypothetical protein|nr:hypothetical protein [Rickettsiales bacterium]